MNEAEVFALIRRTHKILFVCDQMERAECYCMVGVESMREEAGQTMDSVRKNYREVYGSYIRIFKGGAASE